RRPATASTDRKVRGTNARVFCFLQRLLYNAILQRMKADGDQAPAVTQRSDRLRQGFLNRIELAVNGYPQRLKGPLRRMRTLAPGGCGDRRFHDVHQLTRRCDGRCGPRPDDLPGDAARPAFFTVLLQDACQLRLGQRVYKVCGVRFASAVHAHIEWSIELVAEAPLGPV